MGVTWITPTDITPTGFTANTWTDLDVTANVGAGAKGVILHLHNNNASDSQTGVRVNGSTETHSGAFQGDIEAGGHLWNIVGLDGSLIFEFRFERTDSSQNVYLMGWLDDDYVSVTSPTDHALTNSVWTDVDVTAEAGTSAIAGIFRLAANNGSTQRNIGCQPGGSTDDRNHPSEVGLEALVGLDANDIAECFVGTGGASAFLTGYFTAGVTMEATAGLDRSLGSTGSWINLTALPTDAIGGIYEVKSSTTNNYGIRNDGATGAGEAILSHPNRGKCWAVVESTSQICEGQIADTNVDFFEWGSFDPAAGGGATSAHSQLALLGVGV